MRRGERGGITCAGHRVSQLRRGARAVVQEIALGDHPDRRARPVDDAQVPDPEPIHPSQRPVDHLVARHRLHRRAHHCRHPGRIGVGGRIRGGPKKVALGDDSGRARLAAGDEERADPLFGHDSRGFTERSAGRYRSHGSVHHLVEPPQVEEAVDAGQRRRRSDGGRSGHRVPARFRLAANEVGAARRERLRLAEGPYVRLPQPGNELDEDPGRDEAVPERVVPLLDGDAVPVRERFQAEVDEPAIECAREMRDVERQRVVPGQSGARRLVAQHREVEPDVLADHHATREHLDQRFEHLGELRRARDVDFGNPVDPGRRGGDRDPGVDPGVETRLVQDHGSTHRHRTDLDDAVVRDVQSGGLQVERDRGQGRERGMTRRRAGVSCHFSPIPGCGRGSYRASACFVNRWEMAAWHRDRCSQSNG